ncbi:MAG: hypothetical protein JXR95_04360, partial [Deltaproteobacteria bacterium]|nr:hypothetical protein [Deltaproteobacteria bacterium]
MFLRKQQTGHLPVHYKSKLYRKIMAFSMVLALFSGCQEPAQESGAGGSQVTFEGSLLSSPVAETITVSRGFGDYVSDQSFSGYHVGEDYPGFHQVFAPCSGEIKLYNTSVGGYGSYNGAPGPFFVMQCTDHAWPLTVSVGHVTLSGYGTGSTVERGAYLGNTIFYAGPTGGDWSHLHFAVSSFVYDSTYNYYAGYVSKSGLHFYVKPDTKTVPERCQESGKYCGKSLPWIRSLEPDTLYQCSVQSSSFNDEIIDLMSCTSCSSMVQGVDDVCSSEVSETCGDGICSSSETCSSCPSDCGSCITCGDGI